MDVDICEYILTQHLAALAINGYQRLATSRSGRDSPYFGRFLAIEVLVLKAIVQLPMTDCFEMFSEGDSPSQSSADCRQMTSNNLAFRKEHEETMKTSVL